MRPSFYKHRFTIYRRSTGTYTDGNPTIQQSLFKSFAKSIKKADQSAQVLPVRSDLRINPLSTTDQINLLEIAGMTTYFKPYKRTKTTLSGNFHIAMKLLSRGK